MTTPDDAFKLPILPEIAQNRTESHVSPDHLATPVQVQRAPSPAPPPLLSPRQLNAIHLLLTGSTDEYVAEAVGVRREAVNRWRNQHPRFIAELNRQRSLLHAEALDRYDRVLNRALGHIEQFQRYTHESWLEDQVKVATQILHAASRRTLVRDPAAPPPPTDPTEIELHLLSQGLSPSPDDDAPPPPPPPPPPPKKGRR